jgi:hypothetical protein
MGFGFGTPVRAASLLALAACAGLVSPLGVVLAAFALMGFARALPVAVVSAAFPNKEGTTEVSEALAALYTPARALDVVAISAAALLFV